MDNATTERYQQRKVKVLGQYRREVKSIKKDLPHFTPEEVLQELLDESFLWARAQLDFADQLPVDERFKIVVNHDTGVATIEPHWEIRSAFLACDRAARIATDMAKLGFESQKLEQARQIKESVVAMFGR